MVKKAALVLTFLAFLASSLFAQSNAQGSQQIRWDRQTFSIGGKDVILIGGSMHYFRIPQAEWAATFERMREDGFNIVDIYIPWFIHEAEENKFDFDSGHLEERHYALPRKLRGPFERAPVSFLHR